MLANWTLEELTNLLKDKLSREDFAQTLEIVNRAVTIEQMSLDAWKDVAEHDKKRAELIAKIKEEA